MLIFLNKQVADQQYPPGMAYDHTQRFFQVAS